MITGYTYAYNGVVNQLLIDCAITKPSEDIANVAQNIKALWDTGAEMTCISSALVESLSLKPEDTTKITGAENKPFDANVYSVQLVMGRFVIPHLRVAELSMDNKSHDIIIGMDVIGRGDLTITNYDRKTCLTFRQPSIETVNYVDEIDMFNRCVTKHNVNVAHHIKSDKCACGSGKSFINCHGQSKYKE